MSTLLFLMKPSILSCFFCHHCSNLPILTVVLESPIVLRLPFFIFLIFIFCFPFFFFWFSFFVLIFIFRLQVFVFRFFFFSFFVFRLSFLAFRFLIVFNLQFFYNFAIDFRFYFFVRYRHSTLGELCSSALVIFADRSEARATSW